MSTGTKSSKAGEAIEITDAVNDNITKDMLVDMQRSDSSLKTYWDSLNSSTADTAKTRFVIRKQLLYRVSYDRNGKEIKQYLMH